MQKSKLDCSATLKWVISRNTLYTVLHCLTFVLLYCLQGLTSLLCSGVYTAAYPLHDVRNFQRYRSCILISISQKKGIVVTVATHVRLCVWKHITYAWRSCMWMQVSVVGPHLQMVRFALIKWCLNGVSWFLWICITDAIAIDLNAWESLDSIDTVELEKGILSSFNKAQPIDGPCFLFPGRRQWRTCRAQRQEGKIVANV